MKCRLFVKHTCDDINDSVRCLNFPNELKRADIVPVHKKSKFYKKNYRPISILSNVSKIYDRCLYDQIRTYVAHSFSRYQCGFRKGYSSQHSLLAMTEKCTKIEDNGSVLFTDLWKASKLIHHYFSNKKQRVKVNDAYSSWKSVFHGVP